MTWATSVLILVGLSRLRPDVRDRQTDVRQTSSDVRRASSLNAPYPTCGGIINIKYMAHVRVITGSNGVCASMQVIEVNASQVTVEFTAGQGGQTQRGFLIKSEGEWTIV